MLVNIKLKTKTLKFRYTSSFLTVFQSVPCPGPSFCGILMAADSNVCANFQEFLSMLRPPKTFLLLNKTIHKITIRHSICERNKTVQLSFKDVNQESRTDTETRKLLSFQPVKTKNLTGLTEKALLQFLLPLHLYYYCFLYDKFHL